MKPNLLFFDLETTGLDKDKHTILEIAIVKTDYYGNVLSSYQTKIQPTPNDLAVASKKALEINGYNEEDWKKALTPDVACKEIVERFKGKWVLAGQNIGGFDIPFLQAFLRRNGYDYKIGRRYIDTMSLAIEHLMPCGLSSVSLVNVRKALKIHTGTEHTAMADTLACVRVYKKLSRATTLHRLYWSWRIPKRMKKEK